MPQPPEPSEASSLATDGHAVTRPPFHGFAEVWTPLLAATELTAARPVASIVAGTKVVLFRDASGRPVALVDRCPHRGVALSLGKVKDGCLECPFHGWRFDGQGRVVAVPWNPDAKLDRLAGQPIPVRETGGLIWLYTAFGATPPSEPEPPEVLLRSDVKLCALAIDFDTSWTRLMENMLDSPHLPFVHAATIGRGMKRSVNGRMDIAIDESPTGFSTRVSIDGVAQRGKLEFRWPNQMVLHISMGTRTFVLHNTCLPTTEGKSRLLVVTARGFLKSRLFDPIFNWQNRKIAAEDKLIVESSDPRELPPASEERSVRTDAPTLHFRKRYLAELAPRDGGDGNVRLPVAGR